MGDRGGRELSMGNRVVHFEMAGPDGAALAEFYAGLFGWHTQGIPEAGYFLVDTHGGGGINGGVAAIADGDPYVTFYVEADDPQAVLDRAEGLGAKVTVPVTETPFVTYGRFADPDGVEVGVVKAADPSGEQPPGPSSGEGAPVDWFEVLGSDAAATQRFYTELFGWSVDATGFPGYALVQGAGEGVGGGLGSGEEARWATVYANVGDVEAALAKAESLGGGRVYGPVDVDDHMKTGALRDPAGNVFGVYHHEDHD
jgi:predicted enzyme related to lactoylglutathione lyase